MCGADIFLLCLSVLFPPIGVWVKKGICSADSLINIALCCLGYLPGLLHAWYIIVSYPDEYEQIGDSEHRSGGVVTYYYVQQGGPHHGCARGQQNQQPQPHPQPQNYGTVGSQPNAQFPNQQSGTTNAFPAPQQQQQQQPAQPKPQNQPAPAPQNGAAGSSSEGVSQAPPPSYADVIKGDFKVQSHD